MIKVDIRKAYDTVSWCFLKNILCRLGFPDIYIGWILECVSSTSYSISINGKLHGFFKGKRGLRQGDPMSPSLFLLCMEFLSRLLKVKSKSPSFAFHPKCQANSITHVAFADDLILFSRGDLSSVVTLMGCLKSLELCSGLTVSPEKSTIYLAGVQGLVKERILEAAGFEVGSLPVRYLGIPLASRKVSIEEFSPFLETLGTFLQKWNHKSISYAGKCELIRSVVQGVESFWMHIFPMPTTILNKVTSMCISFLWGGRQSRVAWRDICCPKEEGGLGMKEVKTWNMALLSRTLWNIHMNAETLWVKWVHSVYLRGTSIWDYVSRGRDSYLIKRLCAIRDTIVVAFGTVDAAISGMAKMVVGGKFASSMIYDLLRSRRVKRPWMSTIWKDFIPPKYSFTVWLSCRNRLATRDNLMYVDLPDRRCVFCAAALETRQHLYFACPFTAQIWSVIRSWLGITRDMSTIDSATKWLKKEHKSCRMRSRAAFLGFSSTVFEVWRSRNAAAFDNVPAATEAIIARIKSATYTILYRIYPNVALSF